MKMQLAGIAFAIIAISITLVGCEKSSRKIDSSNNNMAQDLLNAAKSAGYNLTMEDIDLAANAKNDDEVAEALPMPVAQKLISHRRRNDMDILREQLIGMVFTGKPQSLGIRRHFRRPGPPSHQMTRRRFRTRPKRPPHDMPRFHGMSDSERPSEILKPVPFVPRQSNVEFPVPPLPPSEPRPRRPSQRPRFSTNAAFRPDIIRGREPNHRPDNSFGAAGTSHSRDIFSNHVGPDFGPVTFEEFGGDFGSGPTFENHDIHSPNEFHRPSDEFRKPTKDFHKPSDEFHKPIHDFPKITNSKPPRKFSKRPSSFSTTKFGDFDEFPKFTDNFPKFGDQIPTNFDQDLQKFDTPPEPKPPLGGGYSQQGGCHTYTEDICLDADNYPHEAILTSLAGDPSRTDTLMAEVKEQSADNLVDGISAVQEARYDFAHYFGNRRQDRGTEERTRDFAQDGGYLCPSEVKYARPKRARNSKGKWKFVVNMDKYTQTIRMEKCMKPGGTCSYVSHHYRAMCNQIYNYQRLLSWEKKRGLHMDIFKVPSCCSCHIQGYAYVFPPLHKSDPKTSRSDRIETTRRKDEDVESINKAAPPYSPVNYPNIQGDRSIVRQPQSTGRSRENRRRPVRPKGFRTQRPISTRRSNQADHQRVNYGYHPIIDFFENGPSGR